MKTESKYDIGQKVFYIDYTEQTGKVLKSIITSIEIRIDNRKKDVRYQLKGYHLGSIHEGNIFVDKQEIIKEFTKMLESQTTEINEIIAEAKA
jgi:hypothetical protein